MRQGLYSGIIIWEWCCWEWSQIVEVCARKPNNRAEIKGLVRFTYNSQITHANITFQLQSVQRFSTIRWRNWFKAGWQERVVVQVLSEMACCCPTATDGETVKFRAKVNLHDLKIDKAVGKQRQEGLPVGNCAMENWPATWGKPASVVPVCPSVCEHILLISQAPWSDWKSHTHFSLWPCTPNWPAKPFPSSEDL